MVKSVSSPAVNFHRHLARHFLLNIPGIYHDYKFPEGTDPSSVERLILNPNIYTNCAVSIESASWDKRLEGHKYLVFNLKHQVPSGEAYERTRAILHDLTTKVLELNQELSEFRGLELSNREMLHLLWGTACMINPSDISCFVLLNRKTPEEAAEIMARQQQLSGELAMIIGHYRFDLFEVNFVPEPLPWRASPETLGKIIDTLSANPEKLIHGTRSTVFLGSPCGSLPML